MKTLTTLIKRECWENKTLFFKTPIVFAAIILLISLCLMIQLFIQPHSVHIDFINLQQSLSSDTTVTLFKSVSFPFWAVLWLVVLYYYLGTLFNDRKDRSILFWKSMPITETETVLSKLVAGIIIAPICTWLCLITLQLILLVITSICAAMLSTGAISSLWSPGVIISTWFSLLSMLLLQMLWLLPLFSWAMLCSAYAKKSPFLCTALPVIMVSIIQLIFFSHQTTVLGYISSRIAAAYHLWSSTLNITAYPQLMPALKISAVTSSFSHYTHYYSVSWGLLFSAIMIAMTILIRYLGYRNER